MDSTFMGTLAGMSARITARDGGALHIAEPGARNVRSLEDLGLDHLMEVDPPDAVWKNDIESIRSALKSPSATAMDNIQRTRHVLEAHQNLSGMSEKNAREFSGVLSTLKSTLSGKDARPEATQT
jgi:hypothetical protein